ncbi:MAG TPA: hypothetical protein VME92_03725 [Acetobacteraceae bacterium]|nr:hypothetical protein [Acetobacteraceae bacterium]
MTRSVRQSSIRRSAFWGLAAALGVAACTPVAAVPPYPPVPPPRVEVVPKPPVSATALSWQPGHWNWTGTGYVWMPGLYVERAGHGTLWQDGYWSQTPNGYVWVPGHWTTGG